MIKTTREQRETLKRKLMEENYVRKMAFRPPLTYRQFRRSVEASFGYIMVPFKGQWLGIEPDGYAHT